MWASRNALGVPPWLSAWSPWEFKFKALYKWPCLWWSPRSPMGMQRFLDTILSQKEYAKTFRSHISCGEVLAFVINFSLNIFRPEYSSLPATHPSSASLCLWNTWLNFAINVCFQLSGFFSPPAFPAFFPCNYIAIVLWPIQAYSTCLTALPRASWGGRCSAEKLMWFSFWVLSIFVLKEVQFDLLIFFFFILDVMSV